MSFFAPDPTVDTTLLDAEYDMSHKRRGKAIIVNNMIYSKRNVYYPRHGSERDAAVFRELVTELQFDPVVRHLPTCKKEGPLVYENLTTHELRDLIHDAASDDYTDYSCFLMVILSYGCEGAVLCCDDQYITMKEIVDQFKRRPTLDTKPKIFMMQLDPAIVPCNIPDAPLPRRNDDDIPYIPKEVYHDGATPYPQIRKIPSEADFLVYYSMIPGAYGWMDDDDNGVSWYAESVAKALRRFVMTEMKYGTDNKSMDFIRVLVRANLFYVEIMYNNGIHTDQQTPAPKCVGTLTKKLYFYLKDNEFATK